MHCGQQYRLHLFMSSPMIPLVHSFMEHATNAPSTQGTYRHQQDLGWKQRIQDAHVDFVETKRVGINTFTSWPRGSEFLQMPSTTGSPNSLSKITSKPIHWSLPKPAQNGMSPCSSPECWDCLRTLKDVYTSPLGTCNPSMVSANGNESSHSLL